MRELAIFDVCDTLVSENTTFGFLRFYHRNRGRSAYALREWLVASKASPGFYACAIAYRFFGQDAARRWLVRSLRAARRPEIASVAADYAHHLTLHKANAPLLDRLETHRRAGDRIALVSSSLDIIIAAIADRLSVEYRASRLGFEGDRCTGHIEDDLTGRKEAAVQSIRGSEKLRLHVYTDNQSDRGLVDLADRATIVVPLGRSGRWGEGQDCEIIRL